MMEFLACMFYLVLEEWVSSEDTPTIRFACLTLVVYLRQADLACDVVNS